MIITTIKIHGRPDKRKEIVQTIKSFSEQLIKRGGCLKAELYRDLDDIDIFYLKEEWLTRRDLEAYMASKFQAVLLGLEAILAESLEVNHAVKL